MCLRFSPHAPHRIQTAIITVFIRRRRIKRDGAKNPMKSESLAQQLAFLREIDQLKSIIRQSPLLDRSRKENSAEHSWHLAMYAWLLQEYAVEPINLSRVMQMLLLHDVVEIDAGDTPIHGGFSLDAQARREIDAAVRLFGLPPERQGAELMALWKEFENGQTAESKFAKALDRFQPLLVNILTDGGTWTESDVSCRQVIERYGPDIARGAPALWAVCEQWIEQHFSRNDCGE